MSYLSECKAITNSIWKFISEERRKKTIND
jgi:hypothetical protein